MLEWNHDTWISFCFQSRHCWLCLDQLKWALRLTPVAAVSRECYQGLWGPCSPVGSWSALSPGLASRFP